MDLRIFGVADERTIDQIKRCAEVEDDTKAVLCADSHVGYSMPIGGVVAYREHVSPVGVGFDIGCGNKAARTELRTADVDAPAVMDEIVKRVSFGMGRNNPTPVDHPVLDRIREAPFEPQREMYDLAAKQLGTVGAGNHYVDLFADEDGLLWVGVHFGSRGFGHKTATTYLELAGEPGGGMDAPPTLLRTDSQLGQEYIAAMT